MCDWNNTIGSFCDKQIRRNNRLDSGVYNISYVKHFIQILEEELKHTKGVIRSRKSKNGMFTMIKRKSTKSQTMIHKTLYR